MLDQLERGRAEHRRDREEEAELGRGTALDAERQRAHDRRARAADAGDHRQALDEADADRRLRPAFRRRRRLSLRFASRSIDRMAMPPRINATATTMRIAEQRLDLLDQDEAEDRRRQEADQDVADEAPRHRVAPDQPFEHRPEGPPVKDDDREDRAELDDDVERRPFARRRSRAARWRGSNGRSRRPAGIR